MAVNSQTECAMLEETIGYEFKNKELLTRALTHSSYSNESGLKNHHIYCNERLEFLGDAVLELVISEHLYDNNKKYSEGKLSRLRQSLVCEKTLARIASSLSLGDYLHLGNGEEADCRKRPKVLADALEAVFGAVYLDCRKRGRSDYKELILRLFGNEISEASLTEGQDYKSLLQQFVEKDGSQLEYVLKEESGPMHSRQFTVCALINNNEVGTGSSGTKKDAEMLAAREALVLFGILPRVKNEE